MIHTEEFQQFLRSADFLAPLGLPTGTELAFSPLGQGEYNLNYTFLHPVTEQKLVLRINRGSQMHLSDQIGYEFSALQNLEPSGRTPKALFCDSSMNCLVMEYLPGRPLRYETDLAIGAEILADIHAVEVPADCRLLEPENPLKAIIEECRQMVSHYYSWESADPQVARLLETLEKEISAKDLSAPVGIRKCIVNTEVNSGNFLINPGAQSYLVDWEKPLISEPAQDLGHFLVPTTTFWKTDTILNQEDIRYFADCYKKAVVGRFETASIDQRLSLYFTVTCLRGVTWCAMAYREYCQPGRDLRNADTFEKLKAYLQPDFLENLLKNYVRKDFLA